MFTTFVHGKFRNVCWYLPLLLFPGVLFLPVFTYDLGNVLTVPNVTGLTDTLGIVRVAQMAHTLNFPLGLETWTNFPSGELNWSLSALTQSFQLVSLWVLGNIFNSFVAANIFLYLGWIFTSAAVMYLSRSLGLSYFFALISGITTQFLQSMQVANATVPSMVFVGFPLLVIAFMIKFLNTESVKYFYFALIPLYISGVFDGYIYYFSLSVFWLLFLIKPRHNFRVLKAKLVVNLFVLFAGSSLPILAKIANFVGADSSGTNRQLLSPTIGLMNTNGFTYSQYFSPHPESLWAASGIAGWITADSPRLAASFIGVGITSFVLLSIYYAIKHKYFPIIYLLIATAFYYLLTLHGAWSVFGIRIPNPTAAILWLFPGALYVDRAAFIVQPLLVVIAFAGMWMWKISFRNLRTMNILALALLCLTFLELQPLSSRVVIDESADYQSIRQVVDGKPFAFLPGTFKGRSWLQQVFIDAPMMNSLQHPNSAELVLDHSFPGAAETTACDLAQQGINYVVLEQRYLEKDPQVRNKLVAPFFIQLEIANVTAYESGSTKMVLLGINSECSEE